MRLLEAYDSIVIQDFFDAFLTLANKEGVDKPTQLGTINKFLSEDLPHKVIWVAGKGYSYILNPKTDNKNPYVLFTDDRDVYVISTAYPLSIEQTNWETAKKICDEETHLGYRLRDKYYDIWGKTVDKVYGEWKNYVNN